MVAWSFSRRLFDRALIWGLLVSTLVLIRPAGAAQDQSVVQIIDPDLDLPTMLSTSLAEAGEPLVAPAPRLVAGEGESAQNHTLIRVLNRYGIAELQFLAYPASITGGVRVVAGRIFPPATQIVAAPFTSTATREIRLFGENGLPQGTIIPSLAVDAPFVIAVGDFIPNSAGEEVAIASRYPAASNRAILIYDGSGSLCRTVVSSLAGSALDELDLSTVHQTGPDCLLATYRQSGRTFLVEPWRSLSAEQDRTGLPGGAALYESTFTQDRYLAGANEPLYSTLWRRQSDSTLTALDAGQRENRFWVQPNSVASATGLPVYTFANGTEEWGSNTTCGLMTNSDGKLIIKFLNGSPFDPYFYAPTANYNADQYQQFAMQVTVTGAPAGAFPCAVYWFTTAGGIGVSPFTLTNGTQTVRLNLAQTKTAASPAYTGTIGNIRVDLPESGTYAGFKNARVEIDWVAVSDSTAYVPTQPATFWTDTVRQGQFRHLRTDASSPAYTLTDFDNTNPDYWTGGSFQSYLKNSQLDYAFGLPSVWEPTYTHRQFVGSFKSWYDANDANGKPRFAALTRLGNRASYSEVGNDYLTSTWAPGVAPLERLFVWPLRAYLRELAVKYRGPDGAPDQMIALEPTHEFEIPNFADDSIGDYHPAMIAGFYAHLLKLHTTLGQINNLYGTSFTSAANFDAPRNQGRGAWDAYSTGNPFFNAWVQYLRKVVLWRVAQTLREALLAGFPPELIKTHQIPANYAVGAPIDGHRISPIDWILSAGTGYGGTRYGIWYQDASNFIKGAQSSGQSMICVGEYHPLTTSQSKATGQLRYMFNHGVQFIHHMTWSDTTLDTVGQNAYIALAGDNLPRPGTTGGVGQIRAIRRAASGSWPAQNYNIIQVGTGPSRQGLLKSVNQDGSFQGAVYVTPFHAAVNVAALNNEETRVLASEQIAAGPVADLNSGDQVEIKFRARTSDANGCLTLLLLNGGIELSGTRKVVPVGVDWMEFREVVRLQNPMDGVTILINSGERDTATGSRQTIQLEQFSVLVEREQIARIEFGINNGTPHVGGVTFDVLSRDDVPEQTMTTPFPPATDTAVPPGAWTLYDRP